MLLTDEAVERLRSDWERVKRDPDIPLPRKKWLCSQINLDWKIELAGQLTEAEKEDPPFPESG
jgi:hypothetical protein